MNKGEKPRFTRRTNKDILRIKAGSQKKESPPRNKNRFNRKSDKKQGIQDIRLLKFLLELKLIGYF